MIKYDKLLCDVIKSKCKEKVHKNHDYWIYSYNPKEFHQGILLTNEGTIFLPSPYCLLDPVEFGAKSPLEILKLVKIESTQKEYLPYESVSVFRDGYTRRGREKDTLHRFSDGKDLKIYLSEGAMKKLGIFSDIEFYDLWYYRDLVYFAEPNLDYILGCILRVRTPDEK